ncbi:MAG: hypothetical protein JSW52_12410 [Candidatus Coatesbacteria bacterium]|nr:MAG: hypothetical protein JSW52_12410 [Candidatus Coatesbacteria bacterium]
MIRRFLIPVLSLALAVSAGAGAKIEGAAVNDYGGFSELVLDLNKTATYTADLYPDKSSLVLTVDAKLKKTEAPAPTGLFETITLSEDGGKTVVTVVYGKDTANYEGYVRKDPPAVVLKLVKRPTVVPTEKLWGSAEFLAGKKILMVDDDDGPSNGNKFGVDVEGYYTKGLDRIGIEYDIVTVRTGGSGPGAVKMSEYPLAIWFSGLDARPVVLSSADLSAITDYLSGGGKVMLVSQNLLSDNAASTGSFRKQVLGLEGFKADTQASSVTGTEGGPYGDFECDLGGMVRPIGNWGDGMKPAGSTAILIGSDGYAYAIANEVGDGRIAFFSVAVENGGTTGRIAELLDPALSWLAEE